MSFLPSLLLYNPLEAFIILLFCNVCSGTKTKTRIILDSYILGALNFVVQYPNMLLESPVWQLTYNIFVAIIIMPIILYIFTLKRYKYKFVICWLSTAFLFATVAILSWINNMFVDETFTNCFTDKIYEFIFNLILRVIQLLLIFILYKRKCLYEKVSQKDGCKFC